MAELRQRKGKKKDDDSHHDKNDEVVKDESDTGSEASSEEHRCCEEQRCCGPPEIPADYPKDIINIGGLWNLPNVSKKSNRKQGCAEKCCATRWWISFPKGVACLPGLGMYLLEWVLQAGKITSTDSVWFWVHHIIFGYLSFMFMWHFLKAMWGNSGKVTKEMVEKYQMPGDIPGRFKINIPEKYKDKFPNILQENLSFAPKYCQMCDQYKPPRTKHCSTCNQCTHRLDHHCPFLFNCVGSVNHGHFLLFWIYGILASAYIVNVAIYCWFQAKPTEPVHFEFEDSPTMDFLLGWIDMEMLMRAGFSCIFSLLSGLLVLIFMSLCGLGWITSVGYNATQFDCEANDDPYDPYCVYAQVGKHNVYIPLPWDFLLESEWNRTMSGLTGKYWYLTWFVPFCPAVIDWDAMMSPTATECGWERFMELIEEYEKINGIKLSEIVQKANNEAPGLRTKCEKSIPAVKE